jgi:hypothetical protein
LAKAGVLENVIAGATAEPINSGASPEKIITRATGDGVITITTNQGVVIDGVDKVNGGFNGGIIDQFSREIVVQDGRGTSRARCTKGGVGGSGELHEEVFADFRGFIIAQSVAVVAPAAKVTWPMPVLSS